MMICLAENKSTYFLCFRKHKSNKINDITFLETHKLGNRTKLLKI